MEKYDNWESSLLFYSPFYVNSANIFVATSTVKKTKGHADTYYIVQTVGISAHKI